MIKNRMNVYINYRYFLFDLDGTLTDPGIGITNSVMYALKKFQIEMSDRSELYPFIGPPLPDSFRKYFGFSEEQAAPERIIRQQDLRTF